MNISTNNSSNDPEIEQKTTEGEPESVSKSPAISASVGLKPARHTRRSSKLSGRKFSSREFQLPKNRSHLWISDRSCSPGLCPGEDTSPDPADTSASSSSLSLSTSTSRLQRELGAGSPAPCFSPQEPLITVSGEGSRTDLRKPDITITSPPPITHQSPLSRPISIGIDNDRGDEAEDDDTEEKGANSTGDICCECDDDASDDACDDVKIVFPISDAENGGSSMTVPLPPQSSTVTVTPPPSQRSIKMPTANCSKKIPIIKPQEDSAQFAMMSKSDPEEAENVIRLRAKIAPEREAVIKDDEGEIPALQQQGGQQGGARKVLMPVTLKSPRGVKKTVSSCRAKTPAAGAAVSLKPVSKKSISVVLRNKVGGDESGRDSGYPEWQEKETEFKKGRYNPKDSFKEDYEVVSMLGDGATSKVLLAKNKRTGATVAIKAIPIDFMGRKEEFKKIAKEIPILKRLSHKNIIRYHDVIFSELYMYIILE